MSAEREKPDVLGGASEGVPEVYSFELSAEGPAEGRGIWLPREGTCSKALRRRAHSSHWSQTGEMRAGDAGWCQPGRALRTT